MPKTNIPPNLKDFRAIRIKLASPEDVLGWSYGEVTKPETINYRTQKPEKEGLFSETIFGPSKDWECYCGKYKRIRYKGIVCDKCGVEVTRAIVRRERMGHITLAAPVSHVWFLRGVPSKMGLLLDLGVQDLERVIYFAAYIVVDVDEEARARVLGEIEREYKTKSKAGTGRGEPHSAPLGGATRGEPNFAMATRGEQRELKSLRDGAVAELARLKKHLVLSETQYYDLSLKYGEVFKADIGAEAVRRIFEKMDLEDVRLEVLAQMNKIDQTADRKRLMRRLRLVEALIRSKIRPEWMFVTVLPVIPPDLRPMVPLDGGRYATSDVNDLYRRVINRNNRLKKLVELKSPEVIIRNEKRMLQEAVDSLIDNSAHRGNEPTATTAGGGKRVLKSLTNMLKGKQGRFRQNLLGKRVDYSGRSVIVVGPELKLHQAGLPKRMALEIFKPFVINRLIYQHNVASNIRNASRLVEEEVDIVWAALEEVIAERVILLNRAPTLHRLGIQAFQPVLIEGSAIRVHPLVCQAFNADFDGDQMAVHLPLSAEAQKEAREVMLSSHNLLKPATGEAVVDPQKDMVLGVYWMTSEGEETPRLRSGQEGEKGERGVKGEVPSTVLGAGKVFGSVNEAILAYDFGEVDLRAKIKVRFEKSRGELDPSETPFLTGFVETSVGRLLFNKILPKDIPYINETMTRKKLVKLTSQIIHNFPQERAVKFLDDIKELGFEYATRSGISWGMDDVIVPAEKEKIVKAAAAEVEKIRGHYLNGYLTLAERKSKAIAVWHRTKEEIAKLVPQTMQKSNPVFMIFDSGARGNFSQLTQMAGMKGVVINPTGETIELPIKPSFKEGFNVLEYFISTHGARKGTTDTALKTAAAGYLTRRLVDVAQDVVVRERDCGDDVGVVKHQADGEDINLPLGERVWGRVALDDLKDKNGKTIIKTGDLVNREQAGRIDELGVKEFRVRSVMRCRSIKGICAMCFGYDLGSNSLVELGAAVGIVTAQAIGEPGTQLTLRTFHIGGVAGGSDITQGLPRVEEVFEVRPPKGEALLSEYEGVVEDVVSQGGQKVIKIRVEATMGPKGGRGKKGKKRVGEDKTEIKEYSFPVSVSAVVEKGDLVARGSRLTEGNLNLQDLFAFSGQEAVERYVIQEVESIYVTQGASINEKYLEVIVRQMFSRVRVIESGDTLSLLPGEVTEKWRVLAENAGLKKGGPLRPVQSETSTGLRSASGGASPASSRLAGLRGASRKATYEQLLLGITKVSLTSDSFLSAASFQETARSLINAAIEAKEDHLRGLKENVIVGRLIPAGTGFRE